MTSASRERNQNWFIIQFKEHLKSGEMLNKDKLIAKFQQQMLSSERTAKEFLRMFERLGNIRLDKGRIEVIRI